MIDARYIKYGALSGLLLLCTIMLSTIEDNQNSVFAQITPAPEKFGSDESSPNSSPSTDDTNDNDDGSTGSAGSDGGDGEDATSTGELQQDSDGQDETTTTPEESDETTTTTTTPEEQDINTEFELTNPLVEEIMNKVNEALSASGITGP